MKQALMIAVLIFVALTLGAETAARPYPVPRPKNPPTRMDEGITGPVLSQISQYGESPVYFTGKAFSREGLLTSSSGGRMNLSYETTYTYDGQGFLIKTGTVETANGMQYPSDTVIFSYELDSLGYPLVIKELDAAGTVLATDVYSYSDSGYSLEYSRQPGEYDSDVIYSVMSLYDNQGRMVSSSQYYGDQISERSEYTYEPATNTVIQYREMVGGGWSEKVVTRNNAQGQKLEVSTYDTQDVLISKLTVTYDQYGNVAQETWQDVPENRKSVTRYQYSYDKFGNPTLMTSVSDEYGEERTEYIYEYY